MRYDRESVSPWAFFLPVALAIVAGNLVSDAIAHLLRDRFEPAPVAVMEHGTATEGVAREPAPPAPPSPDALPQPAVSPTPSVAAPVEAGPVPVNDPVAASAAVEPPVAPVAEVRRLSGPMTARQAGESESCINNTVATRSANGWEQALENDAPVRCEARSN